MSQLLNKNTIENMIYEIRGKFVMLDGKILRAKWHDKEY